MDLSSTIHVSDKVQPGHVILVSENGSIEIDIGKKQTEKMKLSPENYNSLDTNYLYRKDPDPNKKYLGGTHWCRNWTFRVEKHDGKAFMYDTYWGSSSDDYIEVTDDNINEFQIVFDLQDVIKIRSSEVNEYNPEDVIYAATDSGGMTCNDYYWIKKGTKKSKALLIQKTKDGIESLKLKLQWAENELSILENNQ